MGDLLFGIVLSFMLTILLVQVANHTTNRCQKRLDAAKEALLAQEALQHKADIERVEAQEQRLRLIQSSLDSVSWRCPDERYMSQPSTDEQETKPSLKLINCSYNDLHTFKAWATCPRCGEIATHSLRTPYTTFEDVPEEIRQRCRTLALNRFNLVGPAKPVRPRPLSPMNTPSGGLAINQKVLADYLEDRAAYDKASQQWFDDLEQTTREFMQGQLDEEKRWDVIRTCNNCSHTWGQEVEQAQLSGDRQWPKLVV